METWECLDFFFSPLQVERNIFSSRNYFFPRRRITPFSITERLKQTPQRTVSLPCATRGLFFLSSAGSGGGENGRGEVVVSVHLCGWWRYVLRWSTAAVSWRKAAAAPAVVTGTGRGLAAIHDVTPPLTRTEHPVTGDYSGTGRR